MRWHIGDVTVSSVIEQPLSDIEQLIPTFDARLVDEHAWLKPDFIDDAGRLRGVIQAFVVRTPQTLLIVDCCGGNDKMLAVMPQWRGVRNNLLDRLAAVGVAREQVDVVMCTHLHLDHVGWNTTYLDGEWVPTFPHARYLIAREEYEHHLCEIQQPPVCQVLRIYPEALMQAYASPKDFQSFLMESGLSFEQAMAGIMDLTVRQTNLESIAPIARAGLMDLVSTGHSIDAQVRIIPTHGHTPGHVSIVIESHGESAILSGDAIHHPVQMAVPELTTVADSDRAATVATRTRLLSALADSDTLLIGTHFAPPTAGFVRRHGKGYQLHAASPAEIPQREATL